MARRRVGPEGVGPFCFRDWEPPADRAFVNTEDRRDIDLQPPHAIELNGTESPPFSNLSPNLLFVAHPPILKVALFAQLSVAGRPEPVTFNKHVAVILWRNCAGCHVKGAVGPFPLVTYQDAVLRAQFIRDLTARRPLPPWRALGGVLTVSYGSTMWSVAS